MLRRLMSLAVPAGPIVHPSELRFSLADPDRKLRRVMLAQEVARPRLGPPFRRRGDRWLLRFPRPDADRMEYLLELTWSDGRTELVPDPANPLRAPGPFGEKSAVELEAYSAPGWLRSQAPPGRVEHVRVRVGRLKTTMVVPVWHHHGAGAGAPQPHHGAWAGVPQPHTLLLVHDGPEYAEYSLLLHFLDAIAAEGRVPPVAAALLPPVERNETYSASALYAAALAREIVPALAKAVPHERRIGIGASLGALAMLHAHRRHPQLFDALLLQSGSYFRRRFDRQEAEFPRFERISRFVGEVLRGKDPAPIPVAITCGTAEENLANNRAVAAALAEQGYDVRFATVRDAHNWTCWRDGLDPHLPELLR